MDNLKRSRGRPYDSYKYKHPLTNELISVYDYRKIKDSIKRGLFINPIINKESFNKKGRPYGTFKYKNNKGELIGVYEWRKLNPFYKNKYNKEHIEQRQRSFVLKRYGLSLEQYKNITSKCALCGFNKYPCDLHHKDKDKNNNDINNFIGLCQNCHFGIHRRYITPY